MEKRFASGCKKQSEAFLKVHRKTTDEAISRYLASKLSNDAWNSVIGMQNDTFSVTKPQERRIFFFTVSIGQSSWLAY